MQLLRHAFPLLMRPSREWQAIRQVDTEPLHLYLTYVIPLTILGFIAEQIRLDHFIASNPAAKSFVEMYWGYSGVGLVLRFLWTLLEVYILSLFVNVCVSLVGGMRDHVRALKLVAFSFTPIWVGQIIVFVFSVTVLDISIPILSIIYSGYIFYLGLQTLIDVPYPRSVMLTFLAATASWILNKIGRSTIPALIDFSRQWPVLTQETRTLFVILAVLGLVCFVLVLGYGGHRQEE